MTRVPCLSRPSLSLSALVVATQICSAALLAGCARQPTYMTMGPVHEMIPRDLPDNCGAADVAVLTGTNFTSLADHRLAGPLRVLWPGQEINSEVQQTRLNAQVNTEGRILRLFCG